MNDYEVLLSEKNCLENLVTAVFQKYKPYIYKKAIYYENCSRGKINRDDFVSDVYLKLFEFLKKIKIKKIKNKSKFSFYVFVHYATTRVFDLTLKQYRCESCSLNNESFENEISSKEIFSETKCDIDKFFKNLSERQLKIVQDRMKNVHEKETLKKLRISHGTYCSEIIKAKKIFKLYI